MSRKIKSFEVSNFVAFHHFRAIRLICNYIFLSEYIGRNIVLIYLVRLMTPKQIRVLPLPQGNHVAKFGKDPIYRTKFIVQKRSCCQNSIYSNGDLDLWPNDPKINRVLPLPQGNHVAKFGKDPIYRTKVIVWKPVWTPTHPPAIPNHIIRPVSGLVHKKHTYFTTEISLKFVDTNFRGLRKNCIFMDLLL